ncbi:MAG TPA: prepilin peptidase, partial [Candidatus Baltobacteraceae bacterium]|nr:prepilin peptidase [Candidatus Baltobacteraceae bacterium]
IPAVLLAGGLVVAAFGGWSYAAVSIGLCVLVFALGTALFSLKLIGGGDVKLLAAAAAALGWPNSAAFLLYTVLAGGIIGLIIAIARGRLRPTILNLRSMIFPVLSGARPAALPSVAGSMPYGLAIFAGAASLAVGEALGLSLRFSL